MSESAEKPNPYRLALFTAVCAACLTLFGNYFVARFQLAQAMEQKDRELRQQIYTSFLSKVDRKNDVLLSQLLNIGTLAEKVSTDMEIATLEAAMRNLLETRDTYDVYLRLNSDLIAVRLAAGSRVKQFSDDLLNAIVGDFEQIDFSQHPTDSQEYYSKWQSANMEPSIGFDPELSDAERLSIIFSGRLYRDLIDAMAQEIRSEKNND